METQKVVEIGAERKASAPGKSLQPEVIQNLPGLPVLPETLVKLELAAAERPASLARVSDLILSDPGAAIQVMRHADRDWGGGGHPQRIEDAISSLEVQACLEAISKHTITRRRRDLPIAAAWEHAGVIAYASGLQAERRNHCAPEDARWVGLCHDLGKFPEILGWELAGIHHADVNFVGLSIAEAWSLPRCVVEYFADLLNFRSNRPWTILVDQAHRMVRKQPSACAGHQSYDRLDYDFPERKLTV